MENYLTELEDIKQQLMYTYEHTKALQFHFNQNAPLTQGRQDYGKYKMSR